MCDSSLFFIIVNFLFCQMFKQQLNTLSSNAQNMNLAKVIDHWSLITPRHVYSLVCASIVFDVWIAVLFAAFYYNSILSAKWIVGMSLPCQHRLKMYFSQLSGQYELWNGPKMFIYFRIFCHQFFFFFYFKQI